MEEAVNKTGWQKFFDAIDNIDRKLYGKRMKYFIQGALLILIAAPFVDWWLEVPHNRLTYYSTLVYIIFMIILILAWFSSFRDEEGNVTKRQIWSRVKTYIKILQDNVARTKTNSFDELLYKSGRFLIIAGLLWKAFHNLSIFIRKPLEHFTGHYLMGMRHRELRAEHNYWILLLVGTGILSWLYYKNPKILERIKSEIGQLFGKKSSLGQKYHNEIAHIHPQEHVDLVLNMKEKDHVELITSNNSSVLFNDFVKALEKWNPVGCHYEDEFQNDLLIHLNNEMPEANIETEKPIGEKTMGNRGRADVVINDTILIEMKRDSKAGAIQRAEGQMGQYSRIWKDKGPVVLLLCDYEYNHAKVAYTPVISQLVQLERSAIAFVAHPK